MLNPNSVVGLTEKDAVDKIKASGMKARVMRRDNESFFGIADYRTDRMNLEIDSGIVTKADIG
jgi:hypothetical protein